MNVAFAVRTSSPPTSPAAHPDPKALARCDLDSELNCCIGQLLDTLAIRERRLCHVSHR